MDAELEARKKALEEMDAKQREKEEELIRVSERAKEIDFGTLGVAARSTASAPIEAGSDELSLGDTSAFEESGSAWVADDQGGLSISWTGKTASALIGVTGLKRAQGRGRGHGPRRPPDHQGRRPLHRGEAERAGHHHLQAGRQHDPGARGPGQHGHRVLPGQGPDKWAKQADG